jgi:hypothetical protein
MTRLVKPHFLDDSISTAAPCFSFRGSAITSDPGLLAYREFDDTLGLSDTDAVRSYPCALWQERSPSTGPFDASVHLQAARRLRGVNDAGRLCRYPTMHRAVADADGRYERSKWPRSGCRDRCSSKSTITRLRATPASP